MHLQPLIIRRCNSRPDDCYSLSCRHRARERSCCRSIPFCSIIVRICNVILRNRSGVPSRGYSAVIARAGDRAGNQPRKSRVTAIQSSFFSRSSRVCITTRCYTIDRRSIFMGDLSFDGPTYSRPVRSPIILRTR